MSPSVRLGLESIIEGNETAIRAMLWHALLANICTALALVATEMLAGRAPAKKAKKTLVVGHERVLVGHQLH